MQVRGQDLLCFFNHVKKKSGIHHPNFTSISTDCFVLNIKICINLVIQGEFRACAEAKYVF